MIDVAVGEQTLQAVDAGKNEITVEAVGWEPTGDGPDLDRRVDEQLTGTIQQLGFPEEAVSIERTDPRRWATYDPQSGPMELAGTSTVLKVEQSVIMYVAFEDGCVLKQSGDGGTIRLTFRNRSPVTIGFRSRINRPKETITVPATLDGVRTAIRYQAAGILSDTAEKSFPSQRVHPPAIEFGERTTVPAAVRDGTNRSDIRLAVPTSIEALFAVAPLSYYLQSDLTLTDTEAVVVKAPTLNGSLRLGRSRSIAQEVAALLRRVFYLDCLVRNAGLRTVELEQFGLLEELELDAATVYRQSNAERLAVYLGTDFRNVSDRLPEWPLSTVIEPDFASLPAIPHLLDRLSLVQPPDPKRVDRQSLVADSIADSYGSRTRKDETVPRFDLVRNRTRLGRQQAWMSDGKPVNAFRATQSAFEAQFRCYEESEGPRRVVVVINDSAMFDEREAVERIYRARSSELSVDVTVEAALDRNELCEVFESSVDFLHFIGHCDEAGLRCEDGWVSAETLPGSQVRTFFLNVCNSFEEGLELVRSGSVAGAVTIGDVLNEEATRVGMTFARLVMHGFSISRALTLASRRSIRSKFYTVVGDGTHRFSQGADAFPAVLSAKHRQGEEFSLRFEFPQLKAMGAYAKPRVKSAEDYVLRGTETNDVLGKSALADFLGSVDLPAIFEGELHWSTDLADRIRADSVPDRAVDERE